MAPQPSTTANPRQALLQQIVTAFNATNPQYSTLIPSSINPQPIPYFGDPVSAEFATFGVNPSAAELTWSRWPLATMTVQQLDSRLVEYFKNPTVPAHPWFNGYEKPSNVSGPNMALDILGRSYQTDTVHLDLSPRPTKAMGTIPPSVFLPMIAADMQWFLLTVALGRNLKAAIMAGSVTNRYYFHEFLRYYFPGSHSLELRQLLGPNGRAATALYDLVGPGFSFPVLFVSTSPSGDKGVRLAREIQTHLATLKAAGF